MPIATRLLRRHAVGRVIVGSRELQQIESSSLSLYSVSQKNPPLRFSDFFPKRLGIFNQCLHTYYTNISTRD